MKTITREAVNSHLVKQHPNYSDRAKGLALVNVLKSTEFQAEHIPHSINIPEGQESEFERLFDKSKEIIVYCASPECQASSIVAGKLERRGFTNVAVYKGGIRDWKQAGLPVEYRKGAGGEARA